MKKNIAVIRGDGIGPEIIEQAQLVLNKVADLYGHEFTYTEVAMGGNAIDAYIQIVGMDKFLDKLEHRSTNPNPKYERLVSEYKTFHL